MAIRGQVNREYTVGCKISPRINAAFVECLDKLECDSSLMNADMVARTCATVNNAGVRSIRNRMVHLHYGVTRVAEFSGAIIEGWHHDDRTTKICHRGHLDSNGLHRERH